LEDRLDDVLDEARRRRFLSTTRADLERGRWVDPTAGRVSLRLGSGVDD
jgi:hypothetical protein